MRVVRRPGVRPRLLPQSSSPEVRLGAAGESGLPALLQCVVERLPRGDRLRGRRGTRCITAAGTAPRAGRRKVTGRVPDGRGSEEPRAKRRSFPAGEPGLEALRGRASMARIVDVRARRVWDSRGRPTVEAEVLVGRGTTALAVGRAIAPAGASTGSGEAKALDAAQAVQNVNTRIREALRTMSVADQQALDRRMIELDGTPDKRRLGANAIVAVSLACAHADAAVRKVPLWKQLAGDRRPAMPVPQIQIFGGGAHAGARVDIQDYMVICTGAGSFAEALEWTSQIYAAAGKRLAKRGALQGVADEGG